MFSIITNKWALLFINILLSVFLFLFSASEYNLHYYINALFYVSFPYLAVGLLSFVIRGGFFDGIVYSFRRFRGRVLNKDLLDDWADKPNPSERLSQRFVSIFFFQSILLLLLLLILLTIFYI